MSILFFLSIVFILASVLMILFGECNRINNIIELLLMSLGYSFIIWFSYNTGLESGVIDY